MVENGKHDLIVLSLILVLIQLPDFVFPAVPGPFWSEYLFNGCLEVWAFLMIYLLLYVYYSPLVFSILCLQVVSIHIHAFGALTEYLFISNSNQLFADLCNFYSYLLSAILVLKTLVLGIGWYGIFRRKRRNVSSNSYANRLLIANNPNCNHNLSEPEGKCRG